jgi:hypothetical protein
LQAPCNPSTNFNASDRASQLFCPLIHLCFITTFQPLRLYTNQNNKNAVLYRLRPRRCWLCLRSNNYDHGCGFDNLMRRANVCLQHFVTTITAMLTFSIAFSIHALEQLRLVLILVPLLTGAACVLPSKPSSRRLPFLNIDLEEGETDVEQLL